MKAMAVGFTFFLLMFFFGGIRVGGLKVKDVFLWCFCLDVFFSGLMDEQKGCFGCGGERVLFGQSEILLI